jgi:diguanylate cyclase
MHGSAGGDGGDDLLLAAVAEMVKANEQLQSELATAEQKLQQQAHEIELHAADARTDALTQLNNRRAFDAELERRHAEWKRLQVPYSVILIDVDHFKKFNDVHGHLAGDAVLRGVGRVLGEAMREMDVLCRYGGEEFAVILPATEGAPARRGAQRARAAIAGATFDFEGARLQVTASLGLAEVAVGDDTETLVRRADEALYASKKAGRNQVHRHDGRQALPLEEEIEDCGLESSNFQSALSHSPSTSDSSSLSALEKLADGKDFDAALRRRAAEARRTGAPLSLMLVHVDELGLLVNQYGERAGELLLDAVAHCLEVLLRDMDLVARRDEGRFAVLLPGSGLEDTCEIARRLRGTIHDLAVPNSGSTRWTVSVGVAQRTDDEEAEPWLARGERALAAAVANGPDAAFLHDGQSCRRLENEPAHSGRAAE